jgi:phage repressor protein C with HTH and peptisase S24 domain
MSKKSTTDVRMTVFSAEEMSHKRKNRLDIKQIRAFTEKLRDLPDEALMPDWAGLSVGDRFAIVLRLIPPDQQEPLLGKSEGHIRRYERGLDIPLTVVAALAAETEIPLDWIVSGKAMLRRAAHLDSGSVLGLREDAAPSAEDVPVQKLAFKVAAGRGALILDDAASHVRFPRAILQHVGVQPQHARLMEAAGESMRSTINDGDLMLVDVSPSAAQIVEGKIYVFSLGNDAYVKRLRRTGDSVTMISDNREMFPPEDVPAHLDMRIYGRVMWAGRNL